MSRGSSLDAKELVKQAVDIVDLVGASISLRRQGRNFVGLCPWHDDTRPSLQVNPERQSFKCWVCDIGGDVFSFVMKMEGVSFPEALKMLADRAGIQLEPARRGGPAPGGEADKRTLYQAMAWAEKQYQWCLVESPEGEPARRYLQDRRISQASIERFHLGFAPNHATWILGRTAGSGFGPAILEKIGILARPSTGIGHYDRFRGRVLFSIRDPQGRPVGLGGRVLPESGNTSPAKYVNSPETPLFSKSKLLYGLDVARDAMRRSRTALVMEGYTDCIVAQQCGFEDAVAVLGTALGEQHIRTLKRFVDRIVLVLDGDEAGQRRANEVLELFVAQNADLRIVTLPEGLDPAEFLLEHGGEAFRDLLETRALDALEHAFLTATRNVDLERDVHAASQALERLVSIVAKAPRLRADSPDDARFREEKILQRLAGSFRVPEQVVRERLTALRRAGQRREEQRGASAAPQRPAPPTPAGARPLSGPAAPPAMLDPWVRELLELVVRFPEHLAAIRGAVPQGTIAHVLGGRIYDTCCRLSDQGTRPGFDRLMLEFDEPELQNLLVELDEQGRAKGIDNPAALIEELRRSYQRRLSEQQRPAQAVELRRGRLDEGQELDLLRQSVRQVRARHGISEPTDGQGPRPG